MESASDHGMPPSTQTDSASNGAYLDLVTGQRPVFSVEKPARRTQLVILTMGGLATLVVITVGLLSLFSSH